MLVSYIYIYIYIYKVFQIWPGLIVCKSGDISPGHIWTTLCVCVCMYVYIDTHTHSDPLCLFWCCCCEPQFFCLKSQWSVCSLWLHQSIWIHHLISVLSALLQFVVLLFLVIENWSRLLLILTDFSNFEVRWWNPKKFWSCMSTLMKINCLPSTWMFIALLVKPNLVAEAFSNHFQTVISYLLWSCFPL